MPNQNQIQGLPSGVVLDDAPHDAAPVSTPIAASDAAPDATQGVTGLPSGVVLDVAPHDAPHVMSPELQGAYARGQHAPVTESTDTTGVQGVADQMARGAGRIGTGIAKGSAETIHTVGNFLNQHLGIPMPQEILHPELEGGTQAKNAGESAGKFGEAIGEFVPGDEAVKGLSIGERLGMTQKIMKWATEHTFVAKALAVGMNALQTGTVGGTQ